jgi:hypothetical protein
MILSPARTFLIPTLYGLGYFEIEEAALCSLHGCFYLATDLPDYLFSRSTNDLGSGPVKGIPKRTLI